MRIVAAPQQILGSDDVPVVNGDVILGKANEHVALEEIARKRPIAELDRARTSAEIDAAVRAEVERGGGLLDPKVRWLGVGVASGPLPGRGHPEHVVVYVVAEAVP